MGNISDKTLKATYVGFFVGMAMAVGGYGLGHYEKRSSSDKLKRFHYLGRELEKPVTFSLEDVATKDLSSIIERSQSMINERGTMLSEESFESYKREKESKQSIYNSIGFAGALLLFGSTLLGGFLEDRKRSQHIKDVEAKIEEVEVHYHP